MNFRSRLGGCIEADRFDWFQAHRRQLPAMKRASLARLALSVIQLDRRIADESKRLDDIRRQARYRWWHSPPGDAINCRCTLRPVVEWPILIKNPYGVVRHTGV